MATRPFFLFFLFFLPPTLILHAPGVGSPDPAFGTAIPTGSKGQLFTLQNHFANIIEHSKDAVVFITTTNKTDTSPGKLKNEDDLILRNPVLREWFKPSPPPITGELLQNENRHSFGSGFIYNTDGYILTNNHVIKNAASVTVTLINKKEYKATIIGTDSKTDIGILKIDAPNLPFLKLGDSDREKPGHWVLAMGSPYIYTQTVTCGIISATGRNSIGVSAYENFIQTDAAINPGNSGGPLINLRGEVIGINTAYLTRTGGYMGVGFAIPINMARLIAEQITTTGKVSRAWLGVTLIDTTNPRAKAWNIPAATTGAIVLKIQQNSAAEKAGIKEKDVLAKINRQQIKNAADLRNRISLQSPGTRIQLEIIRNGILLQKNVRLGTYPE